MLCSEFDARMQKLLDERRPPERDPALVSHAQGCADCQAQLSTLSQLLDTLDLLETPELPAGFAQRVVDSVALATPATRSRSPLTPLLIALSIAATLLLATVPVTWYMLKKNHRIVAQPTAHSSSELTSSSSLDIVSEGWLVSSAIWEFYPEETRQRHRQQVNRIAHDLRPIATPFNAALTAIRRTLPVRTSERKGAPRASLDRHNDSRPIS